MAARPTKERVAALDQIFGALADPTRRRILDLLRERGECSAGEVADHAPAISRPAVSKHLRILREAGLVEETRVGRFILYRLPAASPIAATTDAWLEPFRDAWEAKLGDLKRFVEGGRSVRSGSGNGDEA